MYEKEYLQLVAFRTQLEQHLAQIILGQDDISTSSKIDMLQLIELLDTSIAKMEDLWEPLTERPYAETN